jgi:phenylacetate-CoA ligase
LQATSANLGLAEVEQITEWLTHRIKTLVGISTRVMVLAPESIERTLTGKARRVVDLRPKA